MRAMPIALFVFLTFGVHAGPSSIGSVRAAGALRGQTQTPARLPDVIYVATPPDVVDAMLKVANIRPIDIDPQRIREATANARHAGVTDRVRFIQADLFEANISEATVVTLYLLPSLNEKLRPKLVKELKPGTRVVSHAFQIGDWKPEKELSVNGRRVYLWTIATTVN